MPPVAASLWAGLRHAVAASRAPLIAPAPSAHTTSLIACSTRAVHTSALRWKRFDDVDVDYEYLKAHTQPPMARPSPELTREELDERARMSKEWSRHCMRKENEAMKTAHQCVRARDEALEALRKLSPELYAEAIKDDNTPYPLSVPFAQVMETPPKDEEDATDFTTSF